MNYTKTENITGTAEMNDAVRKAQTHLLMNMRRPPREDHETDEAYQARLTRIARWAYDRTANGVHVRPNSYEQRGYISSRRSN